MLKFDNLDIPNQFLNNSNIMINNVENSITEEERVKKQIQKNNEELDKLCKTICLFLGWLLVFCLIIYIITIIVNR